MSGSDSTQTPTEIPPQHQERQPGKQKLMRPVPQADCEHYIGSGKLAWKVALVTGGDSGIGRSAAIAFAKEGADVAIVYYDEHEDAESASEKVVAAGQRCITISGDVGDESFCKEAVERTVRELGGLNVLVNNAGEQHEQESLEDITTEQLQRTFRTNILAMFYMTKAALKHLDEGDTIVNTTSVTAYRGSWHLMDYASTKGAIVGFTRSLATSLAKDPCIRVNAVAPGPIWTPLIPASFSEEKVSEFGKNTPMGRPGQPDELAAAYVYLACQDSSYMTGQVLHLNGGDVMPS